MVLQSQASSEKLASPSKQPGEEPAKRKGRSKAEKAQGYYLMGDVADPRLQATELSIYNIVEGIHATLTSAEVMMLENQLKGGGLKSFLNGAGANQQSPKKGVYNTDWCNVFNLSKGFMFSQLQPVQALVPHLDGIKKGALDARLNVEKVFRATFGLPARLKLPAEHTQALMEAYLDDKRANDPRVLWMAERIAKAIKDGDNTKDDIDWSKVGLWKVSQKKLVPFWYKDENYKSEEINFVSFNEGLLQIVEKSPITLTTHHCPIRNFDWLHAQVKNAGKDNTDQPMGVTGMMPGLQSFIEEEFTKEWKSISEKLPDDADAQPPPCKKKRSAPAKPPAAAAGSG